MSDIGKQVVALITDEIGNRDETIARLEKAMSWIAVGEGEPDYGTDTLVVCYGRRRMGRFYSDAGWDVDGQEHAPVTHWMYFPVLPKAAFAEKEE